ncbi:MAG: hypothetical protein DDT40_01549 [candidate division WS2 bacterium]|nr:hypothetical protein [Candidatus Psychracetigena formicireducens]
MRKNIYNWSVIEREFIRGYKDENGIHRYKPTLKQIAQKHGCSYNTLRRRAAPAQENWNQKRNIYLSKTQEKITEKEIEQISDEIVEQDSLTITASKLGTNVAISRLKDENVSNRDILNLSVALLNFQKGSKNVFGEPTDHTKMDGTISHNTLFDEALQKKILEKEGYIANEKWGME